MKKCMSLVVVPLLYSFNCYAGIDVYPMEIGLKSDNQATVQIHASGDNTEFIKVQVKKIVNPGTAKESLQDYNPAVDSELIVSPQKLAIAPGTTRLVRLLTMNKPKQETTWRIYMRGVSPQKMELGETKQQAELNVSLIYGVLVHVAPEKTVVSLSYNPATGVMTNSGTVRIPIKQFGVCDTAGKCKWLTEKVTIYPGMTRKLEIGNSKITSDYRIKYLDWQNHSVKETTLEIK